MQAAREKLLEEAAELFGVLGEAADAANTDERLKEAADVPEVILALLALYAEIVREMKKLADLPSGCKAFRSPKPLPK